MLNRIVDEASQVERGVDVDPERDVRDVGRYRHDAGAWRRSAGAGASGVVPVRGEQACDIGCLLGAIVGDCKHRVPRVLFALDQRGGGSVANWHCQDSSPYQPGVAGYR